LKQTFRARRPGQKWWGKAGCAMAQNDFFVMDEPDPGIAVAYQLYARTV
jgi:hypothetical protein